MSIKKIVDGWKNVVFTDEQVEKLSTERLLICNACPNKIKMMKIDVCGLCHCPLIAKTRSPESKCPDDKWESKNI